MQAGDNMKRKLIYLLTIMILVATVGAAFSYSFGSAGTSAGTEGESQTEEEFLVVTSFYPIYVIARNLTEGIDGVRLQNLTENQTGCLHDYQMTTKDMKLLDQADVLLVNGGGMESFFENALDGLAHLTVISSEEGIQLLEQMSEHNHDHGVEEEDDDHEEHGHEGHDHGIHNAHIWLDPVRYRQQVVNLATGLAEQDPEHRAQYEANRDRYLKEIDTVAEEYQTAFAEMDPQHVIIFHDAFAYYGEVLPLEVVKAVEIEGDESALSAAEMAEVVEEIHHHHIQYLLIEEQYSLTVADVLAEESGAETVVLDSLVTGDGSLDSWLTGMRENLGILQQCLKN